MKNNRNRGVKGQTTMSIDDASIKRQIERQHKFRTMEMYKWEAVVDYTSDVVVDGYARSIYTDVMRVPEGFLYRTETVVYRINEDGSLPASSQLAVSESTVFVPARAGG